MIDQKLHIVYFEHGESKFEVEFLLFLYQVSYNCDRNSQNVEEIPFFRFYDKKKTYLELFFGKNNSYTLIRVC